MRIQRLFFTGTIAAFCLLSPLSQAADPSDAFRQFARNLYELHKHLVSTHDIRTESENGGYGGLRGDPNFYKEVRYIDKKSGRLLSMIQWENKNPDNIHTIEVNIYDKSGRLLRDYTAAYLPYARKAPHQTLIGLRYFGDTVTGYRQFDAAGNILFQECKGSMSGNKFRIVMDYADIPDNPKKIEDDTERAAYPVCFDKMPDSPGKYLNPMVEVSG